MHVQQDTLFAKAEEAAGRVVYWRQQAEAVRATGQRCAIRAELQAERLARGEA